MEKWISPEDVSKLPGMGEIHTKIYSVLLKNLNSPLSIREIQAVLKNNHPNFSRRIRELRRYFEIAVEKNKYYLKSQKLTSHLYTPISLRVRKQILDIGYCYTCGCNPREDRIKLEVDHIIPQSKGGTNDMENLQPLCSDCNAGKKDSLTTIYPSPRYK